MGINTLTDYRQKVDYRHFISILQQLSYPDILKDRNTEELLEDHREHSSNCGVRSRQPIAPS